MTEQVRRPAASMTITEYILEHGGAEVERLRALNAELLEALHVIVQAADLEVAQSIASSAIAIAIVDESSGP